MEEHRSYLVLLGEVGKHLEKLTELAGLKTEAVRRDDLNALRDVLNREQAIALALRGLEQKRLKQCAALGLEGIRLSQLASHFPEELQLEARATADSLLRQYKVYQAAAHVARDTLECNLHEIGKIIESMGGDPNAQPGYQLSEVEPPASMKTDFRA